MKKYKIGYTQGVYDLLHVGHINIFNHAKDLCEYLVVGVNSDSLVKKYKNKTPIINENDRATLVINLKSVDKCMIVDTLDKMIIHNIVPFDVVFIGDDWKGNQRWIDTEKALAKIGCDVIYLPHTDGVSTTMLRKKINEST